MAEPEKTAASAGEFGCIEAVCHDLLYRPELVKLGAGDDGAVYVSPPGMDQVISTDTMVEGIHFTAETMDAADVGWKLCTANFSDMAAMGAEPAQFVISAALPKTLPLSWLEACYGGIRAACRMSRGCKGIASDELCLLVVLNTASIQLLPTTLAGVRASLGAADPFDILPTVWLTSLLSVLAGLLAAKLFARLWRN